MSGPRCSDCRFSALAVLDEGPVVECRRFPPVTAPELPEVSITVDDGEELSTMESIAMHRFPVVLADDWCGEYQAAREWRCACHTSSQTTGQQWTPCSPGNPMHGDVCGWVDRP